MKILSLELYKYDRFSVKGIEYFKYLPETVIQLILGTNGSGKSSLLRELSPLPANLKDEFQKGGYKRIKIEHHGHIYDLLSEKGEKGSIYSFNKNGEELNPGHTVSIFRDLVRVEFNYTQEIHDLMTGFIGFCGMDTASRRGWFTRLPSTDYTYAIRYYKKLSESYRDTTGAIKHVSSRLVNEQDRAISDQELETTKEDLKHLKDYLTFVLESKTIAPYSVNEAEAYIDRANRTIVQTYKRMAILLTQFENDGDARSISELTSQIDTLTTEDAVNYSRQTHLFNEAAELERSIEELERNQADSMGQLEEKIASRKQYITDMLKAISFDMHFDDPEVALETLSQASIYLLEITNELKPDPNREMGRDYYERLKFRRAEIDSKLITLNRAVTEYEVTKKDLLHKKTHDNVECPKCQHVFNKQFSVKVLEDVEENIASLAVDIASLVKEGEDIDKTITELVERFDLLKGFTQVARSYTILEPFWTYLRQEVLFTNPNGTLTAIDKLRQDLTIKAEIQRLTKDDAREQETLQLLYTFKNASLSDLKVEFDKKSSELTALQESRSIIRSKLESRKRAFSIAKEIGELRLELETAMDDRTDRLNSIADVIRNELRGKLIQAIQIEITVRENRLSGITSHRRVLEDLETQLVALKRKKDIVLAAMKILSPSEGLIAKGITGFINHFVGQMNSFIAKIWSYPFEIEAIIPDENLDLDYKFSLKIGDGGTSPDISKTSRGQREIIDLAFRVIAAQYLHLEQFPLYLDEFGASFDKDHRHAAANMMNTLSTTSNFSQVYIISHYEEMYGSFKNTDITMFYDPKLDTISDNAFNKVTTFA